MFKGSLPRADHSFPEGAIAPTSAHKLEVGGWLSHDAEMSEPYCEQELCSVTSARIPQGWLDSFCDSLQTESNHYADGANRA